ncbi:MAG: hypothetical protein PHR94_07660 [Methylomonas lenta]|nr:hypothetical protein [Methylomonas lenta]
MSSVLEYVHFKLQPPDYCDYLKGYGVSGLQATMVYGPLEAILWGSYRAITLQRLHENQ